MKKAIIGIPGAILRRKEGGSALSYVNSNYCISVVRAGGVPLVIPQETDDAGAEALLEQCDGLLLPGGIDIDPRFYGEEPHRTLGAVSLEMDKRWSTLLRSAVKQKKPVLGICRGMQLINVALGGTLWQDLGELCPDHMLHDQKQERSYPIHRVTLQPESRAAAVLGVQSIYTNTLHHQAVREPGEGLRVTGRTVDGVAEVLESDDGLILAVQWHPEEMWDSEPRMGALFRSLMSHCTTETF